MQLVEQELLSGRFGYSDLKSAFQQVHLARRFRASNLVKTPVPGNNGLNHWKRLLRPK
jgi:hypothetical protein